ncbi:MAG: hypothetical protein RLZZ480_891 [Candidatus Parcubacteria bacterium]|jgi:hypothetical protein
MINLLTEEGLLPTVNADPQADIKLLSGLLFVLGVKNSISDPICRKKPTCSTSEAEMVAKLSDHRKK